MKKTNLLYVLIIVIALCFGIKIFLDSKVEMSYEILDHSPSGISFDKETEGCEIVEYNGEYYVFIKSGEHSTGGYSISITRIETNGKNAKIYVETTSPKSNELVTMAFTYPFAVAKFSEKPNVKVIYNN